MRQALRRALGPDLAGGECASTSAACRDLAGLFAALCLLMACRHRCWSRDRAARDWCEWLCGRYLRPPAARVEHIDLNDACHHYESWAPWMPECWSICRSGIRYAPTGVAPRAVGDLLVVHVLRARPRDERTVADLTPPIVRPTPTSRFRWRMSAATGGVRRFVFELSRVHGESSVSPLSGRLRSPVDLGKLEAGAELREIEPPQGCRWSAMRHSLVYGPSMRANLTVDVVRKNGAPLGALRNARSLNARQPGRFSAHYCADCIHRQLGKISALRSDGEDLRLNCCP